jgi:hypothetical protein
MDAYCVANGMRPLLSYGAKGTRVGRKTFIFVAALKQWESLLEQMDLAEAYKRAKKLFVGKMEQLFVVLKEEGVGSMQQLSGANRIPVGSKRVADDKLESQAKK